MTEDLQREFRKLADTAKMKLQEFPTAIGFRHSLSIWIMPSFFPAKHLAIYSTTKMAAVKSATKPETAARIILACKTWRMDLDYEKFRTSLERLKHRGAQIPTIEEAVCEFPSNDYQEILRKLSNVPIPLILPQQNWAGCDGTSYRFQYKDYMHGASINWWEDHPREWRGFTSLIRDTAEELSRLAESATNLLSLPDGNERQTIAEFLGT